MQITLKNGDFCNCHQQHLHASLRDLYLLWWLQGFKEDSVMRHSFLRMLLCLRSFSQRKKGIERERERHSISPIVHIDALCLLRDCILSVCVWDVKPLAQLTSTCYRTSCANHCLAPQLSPIRVRQRREQRTCSTEA